MSTTTAGADDDGAMRMFTTAIFGKPGSRYEPEKTAEYAEGLRFVRAIFGKPDPAEVVEILPNHVPSENTNPALPTEVSEVRQLFNDMEDQEDYNLRTGTG